MQALVVSADVLTVSGFPLVGTIIVLSRMQADTASSLHLHVAYDGWAQPASKVYI